MAQVSLNACVQIGSEKGERYIATPGGQGQHNGCDMKFLLAGSGLRHSWDMDSSARNDRVVL